MDIQEKRHLSSIIDKLRDKYTPEQILQELIDRGDLTKEVLKWTK